MMVVVLGAGGLGSYLGYVLHQARHEVTLVARGDHAAAIERDGLEVRTADGTTVVRVAVAESVPEEASYDLVLITVKAFSLDDVRDDDYVEIELAKFF